MVVGLYLLFIVFPKKRGFLPQLFNFYIFNAPKNILDYLDSWLICPSVKLPKNLDLWAGRKGCEMCTWSVERLWEVFVTSCVCESLSVQHEERTFISCISITEHHRSPWRRSLVCLHMLVTRGKPCNGRQLRTHTHTWTSPGPSEPSTGN